MTRLVLLAMLATATAHAAPADDADVQRIPGAEAFLVKADTVHVRARIGGAWRVTTEPLGPFDNLTVHRAFDASLLAKQPALGLVVESYDGGSGMGTSIDQLVILCADRQRLRRCGEIEIGRLEWALDAEHRARYPDGAFSLRKRPHIELVLAHELVAPDRLRLTLKRSSSLAPPAEMPWEAHTLDAIDTLRRSVGLYRLVDGAFERVR